MTDMIMIMMLVMMIVIIIKIDSRLQKNSFIS